MKLPNCFGFFNKDKKECQKCDFQNDCKNYVKKEIVLETIEKIEEIIRS
jgi:hypothetical protein